MTIFSLESQAISPTDGLLCELNEWDATAAQQSLYHAKYIGGPFEDQEIEAYLLAMYEEANDHVRRG